MGQTCISLMRAAGWGMGVSIIFKTANVSMPLAVWTLCRGQVRRGKYSRA